MIRYERKRTEYNSVLGFRQRPRQTEQWHRKHSPQRSEAMIPTLKKNN